MNITQLSLFGDKKIEQSEDNSDFGTFKDCLKAPIYRWFTYPAGFSFKAPKTSFINENLNERSVVYDPFMGSGTTNLTAKIMGIISIGIEAHPFVYNITKCKLLDEVDELNIIKVLKEIELLVKHDAHTLQEKDEIIKNEFPELILKCFLPATLYELLLIRNYIREIDDDKNRLFLNTGLICCLRLVSIAATGWPYIAPNKIKITSLSKNGIDTYINFIHEMIADTRSVNNDKQKSHHKIILGDSRATKDIIEDNSIDHILGV